MIRRCGPARPQAGFSLLEVLVAFAILALSLGILMQIFSTSGRAAVLGDHYARAAELAESTLALVGSEYPLEPGRFDGEQAGYGWRVDVQVYEPGLQQPPKQLHPYKVTVTVYWAEADRTRRVVLDTLMLNQVRQ